MRLLKRNSCGSLAVLTALAVASCGGTARSEPPSVDGEPSPGPAADVCSADATVPTGLGLLAIRERLRNAVAVDSAVSAAIAVLAGDSVMWSEAFGLADRERGTRASAGIPYAVASVTKPVTAAAVLRLVERGSVELDQPINAYLGDAGLHGPDDWVDRGTIRDLLRHRGGLPLHFHFIYADEEYQRPTMDETISRYGLVAYPPGERSVYSNLGFGILERLIEVVDGRSYETFVEEEVFDPLGIRDAWVGSPDVQTCALAPVYAFDGERLPPYDFDHRGASAVTATAQAMARFGAAHFERPPPGLSGLLSADTRNAIHTDTVIDPGGRVRGLGWTIRRHGTGHVLIEHSGGMPGALSMLRVAPEARISVFAVSNSETSGLPGMISDAVLDALLPAAPRPAIRDAPPKEAGGRSASPVVRPENLAGRWCGTLNTWQDRRPIELRVSGTGDSASITWPGRAEPLQVDNFGVDTRGRATGRVDATIETPDAGRSPHYVQLDLWLHEAALTGAAIAMAVPPYAKRVNYGLPSYVRLERSCGADSS